MEKVRAPVVTQGLSFSLSSDRTRIVVANQELAEAGRGIR